MIEWIITVVALILLVRSWLNPRKKRKSSAVEKGKNSEKQNPESIIGKSTFVLSSKEKKPALIEKQDEPVTDSSGKMDIEIPLDYEPDKDNLLEEQEELERLGLQTDYSANITFDEMMMVVNEVGNNQTDTTPETGKLLYENENTDWVEQLATSSGKNANRIATLIDLHLGRLAQPEKLIQPNNDELMGFDIGEYI
jgi:hypothetical protein